MASEATTPTDWTRRLNAYLRDHPLSVGDEHDCKAYDVTYEDLKRTADETGKVTIWSLAMIDCYFGSYPLLRTERVQDSVVRMPLGEIKVMAPEFGNPLSQKPTFLSRVDMYNFMRDELEALGLELCEYPDYSGMVEAARAQQAEANPRFLDAQGGSVYPSAETLGTNIKHALVSPSFSLIPVDEHGTSEDVCLRARTYETGMVFIVGGPQGSGVIVLPPYTAGLLPLTSYHHRDPERKDSRMRHKMKIRSERTRTDKEKEEVRDVYVGVKGAGKGANMMTVVIVPLDMRSEADGERFQRELDEKKRRKEEEERRNRQEKHPRERPPAMGGGSCGSSGIIDLSLLLRASESDESRGVVIAARRAAVDSGAIHMMDEPIPESQLVDLSAWHKDVYVKPFLPPRVMMMMFGTLPKTSDPASASTLDFGKEQLERVMANGSKVAATDWGDVALGLVDGEKLGSAAEGAAAMEKAYKTKVTVAAGSDEW